MASTNKRKTTMAKLNRERGLAERRLEKQAKKAARKQEAADRAAAVDAATEVFGDMARTDAQDDNRS
jgi:hypothetical protein